MVDWNEPVDKALSQTSYWKTFDQFRLESLNRVQVNPVDLKVIPGDTESRSSGFTSQMLSISQFENTTFVWMYIHRKRLRFYQLVKSHCATDVFSGFHAKKCFPQPANDVCNMICNRLLDIFGWDSLPRIFLQHLNKADIFAIFWSGQDCVTFSMQHLFFLSLN